MEVVDFSRSFVTFRIDTLKKPALTVTHKPPFTLNNARVQIECRCEIKERRTGITQEFILGASCKTERVGVERDIWTEPNADFAPVFSRDRFLSLKTLDRADKRITLYPPSLGVQSEHQTVRVAEAFNNVRIDLRSCEGKLLETQDQIIKSVLANDSVVARTQIEEERYVAVLEYPVKTMNVSERHKIYQTDTGPVLLPDLSKDLDDLISGLALAFAAFNSPGWTEFIVRARTPVEGVDVYHYSRTVRLDTVNQVIGLKS